VGSGVACSDDDLAAGVALFQVADGLGGLVEEACPVDDRLAIRLEPDHARAPAGWTVTARVERFTEPAVLLLLTLYDARR
jgi:hypothetical protein